MAWYVVDIINNFRGNFGLCVQCLTPLLPSTGQMLLKCQLIINVKAMEDQVYLKGAYEAQEALSVCIMNHTKNAAQLLED
jgi:hypothetical protein